MKKITTIILSVLFLTACNEEKLGIDTSDNFQETEGIKVNLTIARSDVADTKASVKTSFADNDVVYIFFKGIAAPKYLEMKYNSSESTWTATAKNELSASDLSGAADKRMTAIYLPYGSDATVVADGGAFKFQNGSGNPLNYTGYYLQAEQVAYSYEADVLSGSISLIACALDDNDDRYIHFDISGFTSGHSYKLYQNYIKPLALTSVSADGSVSKSEGSLGGALTGYEDGSMMSFSGILDASAVDQAVDYQFTIDDLTSSILYTRDAGTKTLSASKYIGIGAINNSETWNAVAYVDLGLSVRWATFNVGASAPEEYGDYFAWGETTPYYEAGYAQEDPQSHWKDGKSSGYAWSSYKYCNGSYNTFTKYCNDSSYGNNGFTDTKTTLDPEDDVSHVVWGGSWRMPTHSELAELINSDNCTWTWITRYGVNGYLVTSKKSGFEGISIFLPAAGRRNDDGLAAGLLDLGYIGQYWSSSLDTDNLCAWGLIFGPGSTEYRAYNPGDGNRNNGVSVRPVCP
jgi:hypothetical protein